MASSIDNSPVITLADSAANQIKSLQAGEVETAGKPLRIYIEQGGCSVMQYGMICFSR
jgi:Fe-S cluster assembly iron-binding protein IscA